MGQAALDAARQGHRVVMTPAKVTYLIRYQGPQWFEPLTYFGNNRLLDIYSYEPLGPEWSPEMAGNLLGVQASLWTEFCSSVADVNYLAFPRLAALAEIGWTRPEDKDWVGGKGGIAVSRHLYFRDDLNLPFSGVGYNLPDIILRVVSPGNCRFTLSGIEPFGEIFSRPFNPA